MRIAVFGTTGQLGRELARRDHTRVEKIGIDREQADFSDPDSVVAAARGVEADVIVNATAYTAVDKAEEEVGLATLVNATSVGALAGVAAERGLPLVHVSTDYVFDGTGKEPHAPYDTVGPLNAYGRSKLEGEEAIRSSGASHAILRTSWVFSAHGSNFVKSMLRLSETRDTLDIVGDQIGGPTPAAALADAVVDVARTMSRDSESGIWHFSGAPDVSWADFAREIFAQAGRNVEVTDITTSAYPTPARRPQNSRLDCSSLTRDHGIDRPDWRLWLDEVLKEIA